MTAWDPGTESRSTAPSAPIAERLAAWLLPRVFLISVAFGFAAAAALGWLSIDRKMFGEFYRFHQLISSESFFNPTALQVRHLLDQIPADKIVVIVGGTSRLYGVGQTPAGLWSGALQEGLGPRYRVINLALRAGRMEQFGSLAAEMLLRRGRRVILLGDLLVTETFLPPGGVEPYGYFYPDAAARGLLLDWPPRSAAIAELRRSGTPRTEIDEGKIRAWLNVAFNFDELWTYVAYYYGTWAGWHQLLADRWPFAPRSTFPDPELHVPPGGYYSHYPLEKAMVEARRFATPLPDTNWGALAASLDLLPDPVRTHLLVLAIRLSPYYTDHYVAAERAGYQENHRRLIDTLRGAGVRSMDVGEGWTGNDYVDGAHLSESGGRKLAAAVAPVVHRFAIDLGYDR